jgi:hypothetical protein
MRSPVVLAFVLAALSVAPAATLAAAAGSRPSPAPSSRPVVTLDAATLDSYVGTYLTAAGDAFTIARSGGGITVQQTGQPAFPLFASAKDRFYLKVVPAQIEFVRDDKGSVTGMMLHQNGQNVPALKQ